MKIYYRISDKSYPKIKLPGATKRACLENLINVFMPGPNELHIIADNCRQGTLDWLRTLKFDLHETNLGNAGALLYALNLALQHNKPLSCAYFVEDDYLHKPGTAYWALQEGEWAAASAKGTAWYMGRKNNGYWTLYDHPDKYSGAYFHHEVGKITRTKTTHWKQSISTTMTFATTMATLKNDFPIWEKFLKEAKESGVNHPRDHEIFQALGKAGRELYVSIPGASCHTDMTLAGMVGTDVTDVFAIELMYDKLFKEVTSDPVSKLTLEEMMGISDQSTKNFNNLARVASVWESMQPPVEYCPA